MTTTTTYQGMEPGSKSSSRVLRPPGGGSNISLGTDEEKPPVRKNKMASSVFAEPEDPYANRRNNPPGGKPTGVLCGEPSAPLRRGGNPTTNHTAEAPATDGENSVQNIGSMAGGSSSSSSSGVGGCVASSKEDNGPIVLDNPAAFPHEENLGLEIIREESNAPLLPPRPPPPDSHPPPPPPPHSFSRPRRIPQETSESFFPLLTNEHTDEHTHSPNHRDSLYTSMPVLTELPDGQMNGFTDGEEDISGELQPCKSATAPELDDVYYKSMPNLGSRNHLHELQSYYHMGRGGSDGYMVSGNKEESDSSPEEPPIDPSHLVTSL